MHDLETIVRMNSDPTFAARLSRSGSQPATQRRTRWQRLKTRLQRR